MTREAGPPAAAPFEVLATRAQVTDAVERVAAELSTIYEDDVEPPILVGVLKGSTLFLADLIRAMPIAVQIDFMAISSYEAQAEQPSVVRIVKDLEHEITGRDVVIVEDIVDTGLTLAYLRRTLLEREPRSLRTVTLLDKAVRRIVPVELEHRVFEIPDVFVVGYGMDFQGHYRNVPQLVAVRDLPRLAAEPRLLVAPLFGAPQVRGAR